MNCPEHTKILFVIGDNGYSADAQRRRGRRAVSTGSLANRLKGSEEKGVKNIVTFFIQTPNGKHYARNPALYDEAYHLFKEQAYEILSRILPSGNEPGDYFMKTDDRELNDKIIAGVKGFSNTQAVNEIIVDLRGGASLVDAIKRLRGAKEYNNIPGLFWDLVKQASAKELGYQYDKRIHNAVLTGYIPISEDIVEDVQMSSDQLDHLIILLGKFIKTAYGKSGRELRIDLEVIR